VKLAASPDIKLAVARQNDIVAIKTRSGRVVGFHAHNLQVAELGHVVWEAMAPAAQNSENSKNLNDEFALKNKIELDEARAELLEWNSETDPSVRDSVLPKGFRSLAINVAQLCNLKCTYCAAGGDGTFGDPMKQVDLGVLYDQIRMLLHDVPNGGEFKFTFLGGEPLLAPDAMRLIHRFAKLQVAGRNIALKFDIVTNGTLVTPAMADLLASMKCHVTVSLDGPPEYNDISRPTKSGKGSTKKALEGLANLVAVKDRLGSLSVGSVFGQHFTDVVATYKFLQPMALDSIRFDFAVGEDDSKASEAYVQGLSEVADLAFEIGGEPELRRLSMFDLYFRILDGKQRIRNHCGAGKTHLHVDTRGSLTTCQWFVGVKDEQVGFGTKIEHEKLTEYADALVEQHSCQTCWVRNLCGGGCMYVNKTKTGSKHTKDTGFCTRTRTLIAKGIEKYAESRYTNDHNESELGEHCETH
jgi:uncharacterized protein